MKTNLELAQQCGFTPTIDPAFGYADAYKRADAFAALVEQRYRERLMEMKVEPVGWRYPDPKGSVMHWDLRFWLDRPSEKWREGEEALYTAEQCAAKVAQAMPQRLTREQVDACRGKAITRTDTNALPFSDQAFADAIQDALGIKEPDHG